VSTDQAAAAVVAVDAEEPPSGGELVGEEVTAVVTGLVDDVALGWVVLEEPAAVPLVESVTGAATWSGATGRSLTWASAALTICQVSPEAIRATITHAPTRLHLLMKSLSQELQARLINQTSRFSQGRE
jgi:hypothetical protein